MPSFYLSYAFDKGKPTERWGRKATDLREIPMIAGLPIHRASDFAAATIMPVLAGIVAAAGVTGVTESVSYGFSLLHAEEGRT